LEALEALEALGHTEIDCTSSIYSVMYNNALLPNRKGTAQGLSSVTLVSITPVAKSPAGVVRCCNLMRMRTNGMLDGRL
ncbi:MAG: hypothetical protein MJE68_15090, partial [Proteobacteria bacterium]|nr:hypothetical protein [Pseudomonadota bacterium]